MSNLTVDLSVVEDGIALLPTKLRESESDVSIKSMLTVFLRREQRMEIILLDLYWMLWDVDRAYGVYLDRLGSIVGQAREGRNDPQYRLWIKARKIVDQSMGRLVDIQKIVKLLDPTAEFDFYEWKRVGTVVVTNLSVSHSDLYAILREAKAAGVRFDMLFSEVPLSETFRLDVGPGLDDGLIAGQDSIVIG